MGNSETMVNYVKTITDEEELYRCISFYDWDEGYEVPKAVSENQYCTLPVALSLFELAGGYYYLQSDEENNRSKAWFDLVGSLYQRIINNDFPEGRMPFYPDLDKEQIRKLKKELPEEEHVFITAIPEKTVYREWKESEKMLEVAEYFQRREAVFPVNCPECLKKSAHVYYDRDETEEGDLVRMWAWCSSCNSYICKEATAPVWWQNLPYLEREKLHTWNADEPERYAEMIDTAVNSAIDLNSFSKGVCNRYNCANVNFEEKIYPPCFMDQCGYTVFIKEIEKEKKSLVAKLFLVDPDELIRIMMEEKSLQTTVNLFDAIRLEQELEKIGVEAMIIPRIEERYPKIHTCKHIKIKVED